MHREPFGDDQPASASRPRTIELDLLRRDAQIGSKIVHGRKKCDPIAKVQSSMLQRA